jgi:hypothetical protein
MCRKRSQEGNCNTCALSSRRFQVCDYLHCGGDERAGLVVPACILFRSSEAFERDYTAAFEILVRPPFIALTGRMTRR